jgi:hypothetical protein
MGVLSFSAVQQPTAAAVESPTTDLEAALAAAR